MSTARSTIRSDFFIELTKLAWQSIEFVSHSVISVTNSIGHVAGTNFELRL